ncbi:50S ribosome-binding GTPase [Heliobacterium chlorum]|uniref:50S ribosome-binding GTPase n=1 Tax=Heliobacterium chlorum TaxID=2698 RepID=A0ABR7T3X4_HELCL|nr:FeoB small GTPase domain-containing protein [Heliobacterium chlorum]MBC9784807.1 50S ribosome-binding GTPase [Heliobacterium chlorum]
MGEVCRSCAACQLSSTDSLRVQYNVNRGSEGDLIIALAGNPNVGKSTIFNALTGLRQHTGNWPGKTVTQAQGTYRHREQKFVLVDLPGTYSLLSNSVDEEVARDFICFGQPDATIIVVDATSLARNLNLVLQVLEITPKVVLSVNLMDEAKSKGIRVDLDALSQKLGVPVIGTTARSGAGLDELKEKVYQVALGYLETNPISVTYDPEVDEVVQKLLPKVKSLVQGIHLNPYWVAMRLMDGDESFLQRLTHYTSLGEVWPKGEAALCPR